MKIKFKVGRVQFIKPVNVPHYNTFEGIMWKDHRHELDMVFEDGWLIVRGMPERLKGRMVEVMVPESNIAGLLTMEAEQEWSREDEKRRAEQEAEQAESQRQEERNKAREDARSQPRSSGESVASKSSSKKAVKRGGGAKITKGLGEPKRESF